MTDNKKLDRRGFIKSCLRTSCGAGLAAIGLTAAFKTRADNMVWQIDPAKCVQCGNCETKCVLELSAVKCVHDYSMCGYCDLCTGYFEPEPRSLDTGAENELCPTGAIKRRFVEEPYFEYNIKEGKCTGCAKCVKGCGDFGNGSLFLQVKHNICLNCNECAIAISCPGQAFKRVPIETPYILKGGTTI